MAASDQKIVYSNGSTYVGDIENGVKSGFGKLVTKNGESSFEGYWENDLPEGSGVLINDDGHFNGEFSKGELRGYGKVKYKDESFYQGYFQKSLPHGTGTMLWPDNDVYEGDFANGEAHGYGIHSSSDGTYKGEWVSGCMTGYGTFTYHSGTVFTGTWAEDKKEGSGYFEFINGCKFKGNFANNKAHGFGNFEGPRGFSLSGEWRDGVLKDLVKPDTLDEGIFSDSTVPTVAYSAKTIFINWKPMGVGDWGNYRMVPDLETLENLEPSIFESMPLRIAKASASSGRSNESNIIESTPVAITKPTGEETPHPVIEDKIGMDKDSTRDGKTKSEGLDAPIKSEGLDASSPNIKQDYTSSPNIKQDYTSSPNIKQDYTSSPNIKQDYTSSPIIEDETTGQPTREKGTTTTPPALDEKGTVTQPVETPDASTQSNVTKGTTTTPIIKKDTSTQQPITKDTSTQQPATKGTGTTTSVTKGTSTLPPATKGTATAPIYQKETVTQPSATKGTTTTPPVTKGTSTMPIYKKETATQSTVFTDTSATDAGHRPVFVPMGSEMTTTSRISGIAPPPVTYYHHKAYAAPTEFREFPGVEKEIYIPEVHERVTVKEVSIPQYLEKDVPVVQEIYLEEEVRRQIPVPVEHSTELIFRLPKLRRRLEVWKVPVYAPRLVEIPYPYEYLTQEQNMTFSKLAEEVESDSKRGLLGESLALYGEIFEAVGKELSLHKNLDTSVVANRLISKSVKNIECLVVKDRR